MPNTILDIHLNEQDEVIQGLVGASWPSLKEPKKSSKPPLEINVKAKEDSPWIPINNVDLLIKCLREGKLVEWQAGPYRKIWDPLHPGYLDDKVGMAGLVKKHPFSAHKTKTTRVVATIRGLLNDQQHFAYFTRKFASLYEMRGYIAAVDSELCFVNYITLNEGDEFLV